MYCLLIYMVNKRFHHTCFTFMLIFLFPLVPNTRKWQVTMQINLFTLYTSIRLVSKKNSIIYRL